MQRRAPWFAHEDGQGLVEYAVILGLTSVCIVLALLMLRDSIANPMQGSSQTIEAAGLTNSLPPAGRPGGAAGEPADGIGSCARMA